MIEAGVSQLVIHHSCSFGRRDREISFVALHYARRFTYTLENRPQLPHLPELKRDIASLYVFWNEGRMKQLVLAPLCCR
jgi:hypothetical protein